MVVNFPIEFGYLTSTPHIPTKKTPGKWMQENRGIKTDLPKRPLLNHHFFYCIYGFFKTVPGYPRKHIWDLFKKKRNRFREAPKDADFMLSPDIGIPENRSHWHIKTIINPPISEFFLEFWKSYATIGDWIKGNTGWKPVLRKIEL